MADATDVECRRYFFCVAGSPIDAILTCNTGLRFNRITGLCDRATNVDCRATGGPGGGGERCPSIGVVDVSSSKGCDWFVPCNNGVPGEPIQCGGTPPLHFNRETRTCDLPENLKEPCTDTTSM